MKPLFGKKKTRKQYEKNVYLFGLPGELEPVMHILCDTFGTDAASGSGNTLQLHNGDITVNAVVICESINDEAKAYVTDQRDRTRSHFMTVETAHTGVRTNLFYQLGCAGCFISVHYTFSAEDIPRKRAMVEDMLIRTLPPLHGVMLIPGETNREPDAIYCADADGSRQLILSETGESTFDTYLPRMGPELHELYPDIPARQLDRRKRSRRILKRHGIYVPGFYPVIESETKAVIRTPEEIAGRAVALMTVSLYSECLLAEDMTPSEALGFVSSIIDTYCTAETVGTFFSPNEWEYLHNADSTQQERLNGSWQYENLWVMEWALGFVDTLDFPQHYCDVPESVRLLKNCENFEDILAKAKPRTASELLDACDLIFCLDWACVDARMYRFPMPAGMDGGVVQERHRSLNWLTGYDESAAWDDVGTDT